MRWQKSSVATTSSSTPNAARATRPTGPVDTSAGAPASFDRRPPTRSAACLRIASERNVAVVTQAGNTGLVGGSVPRPGRGGRPTIVLSTRRLDTISDVDTSTFQLTVGAGVTIADWQRAARARRPRHARRLRRPRLGHRRRSDRARTPGVACRPVRHDAPAGPRRRGGARRRHDRRLAGRTSEGDRRRSTGRRCWRDRRARWRSSPPRGFASCHASTTSPRCSPRSTTSGPPCRCSAPYVGVSASLDSIEIIWPDALDLVASHLATAAPVAVPRWRRGRRDRVRRPRRPHRRPPRRPRRRRRCERRRRSPPMARAASSCSPSATASPSRSLTAATASGTPTYKLDVAVPVASIGRLLDAARDAAERHHARG